MQHSTILPMKRGAHEYEHDSVTYLSRNYKHNHQNDPKIKHQNKHLKEIKVQDTLQK